MVEHPHIARVRVFPGISEDTNDEPRPAPRYHFTGYTTNGDATVFSRPEGYENHLDALAAARSIFPDAEFEDVVNQ